MGNSSSIQINRLFPTRQASISQDKGPRGKQSDRIKSPRLDDVECTANSAKIKNISGGGFKTCIGVSDSFERRGDLTGYFSDLIGFEVFHPTLGFGIIKHIYEKEDYFWAQMMCQMGCLEDFPLHPSKNSPIGDFNRKPHVNSIVLITKII